MGILNFPYPGPHSERKLYFDTVNSSTNLYVVLVELLFLPRKDLQALDKCTNNSSVIMALIKCSGISQSDHREPLLGVVGKGMDTVVVGTKPLVEVSDIGDVECHVVQERAVSSGVVVKFCEESITDCEFEVLGVINKMR